MTKALNVSEDIYLMVFNKWVELRNEGENIGIGKVAENYIKFGAELMSKKGTKSHITLIDKDEVR